MMRICGILEMDQIDKGSVITLQSPDYKSIFFLKKGTVKIIDTKNDVVKYVVKKGHIFGELSLYDSDAAAQEQAIALEDCIVCFIESDLMMSLMEKHKSLKNGMLKIYGLRIRRLERRLEDLLYKDSKTRIKEFVESYLAEFGEQVDDQLVADNLLSHKDIANLTNTSRQTVSNVLSGLRNNGELAYTTKTISIPATTMQK